MRAIAGQVSSPPPVASSAIRHTSPTWAAAAGRGLDCVDPTDAKLKAGYVAATARIKVAEAEAAVSAAVADGDFGVSAAQHLSWLPHLIAVLILLAITVKTYWTLLR